MWHPSCQGSKPHGVGSAAWWLRGPRAISLLQFCTVPKALLCALGWYGQHERALVLLHHRDGLPFAANKFPVLNTWMGKRGEPPSSPSWSWPWQSLGLLSAQCPHGSAEGSQSWCWGVLAKQLGCRKVRALLDHPRAHGQPQRWAGPALGWP